MKYIWFFGLASVLFLSACRKKEVIEPEQLDRFVKFYAQEDDSRSGGMVQLSDGWLLAGTYTTSSGVENIFTVRTDLYGNTLWVQRYASTENQISLAIKKCSTGFVICGTTEVALDITSALIIRIDDAGAQSWTTTIGTVADNQVANDIIEGSNGDIIFAGYDEQAYPTGSGPNAAGTKLAYCVGLDASGAFKFDNYQGGTFDDWYSSIIEFGAGYQCVGSSFSFPPGSASQGSGANSAIFVIGVPITGSGTWEGSTYGNTGVDDFGTDVVITSSQNVLIGGMSAGGSFGGLDGIALSITYNSTFLTKTLDWTNYFGTAGDESISSVSFNGDNGYIFCGTTNGAGAGLQEHYLVRTNSVGDEVWSTTFGYVEDDYGWEAIEHADGGFVTQGTSVFGGARSMTLFRTDAEGEINNLN